MLRFTVGRTPDAASPGAATVVRMTSTSVSGARFVRTAGPGRCRCELDDSQRAVIELADGVSAAVLGAPGTGKTTTIVELVADRVLERGWSPDEVLVLTPIARDRHPPARCASRCGSGAPPRGRWRARSSSFAFEIATRGRTGGGCAAAAAGHGRRAGCRHRGACSRVTSTTAAGPSWPDDLGPEVRRTARFRTELRELITRATEYDVDPARLRRAGRGARSAGVGGRSRVHRRVPRRDQRRRERSSTRPSSRGSPSQALAAGDPGERASALRLVVVDDLQEATEATFAILRALAARGVAVIAFGDPDVAANAFRGGETDVLGRLADVLRIAGPAARSLCSTFTGTAPRCAR